MTLNILIVTLAMTTAGHGVYYNTQDVGLGRALARRGHKVDIYKFVKEDNSMYSPEERLCVHYIHSRSIGSHSVNEYAFITEECNLLLCFSDNQIGFGRLKRRCRKLHVQCLPYVGVLGSNSTSGIKRKIKDLLASNVRHYRDMTVLAKTPQVQKELKLRHIENVVLAPVGLDDALLHTDYAKVDKRTMRGLLHLPEDGKIILFLARMTEEKRPLAMTEIFDKLYKEDSRFHLVVIGKGELEEDMQRAISQKGLEQSVTYLEQVPNATIWQYFCAADVFVNLNIQEIFGMAILEAMYYECAVVARRAPGPEYIIADLQDGILCESDEKVWDAAERLCKDPDMWRVLTERAHEKVMTQFLWNCTAELIGKEVQGV